GVHIVPAGSVPVRDRRHLDSDAGAVPVPAEAVAIYRAQASSDVHCSVIASNKQKVGIIVAQFEPASLRCILFRYQSVCRDLVSGGASSDCRVLIRFPIKYPAQLNPKLTNVWLGDDMSAFENVVCQADEETNRIYPVGVQWTEEGAAFDGSSSFLAMNKSDIGFGTGVTVLLRMKRQPQVQAFFDFLNCADFETGRFYSHIWEHGEPLKPYVFIKTQASSVPQVYPNFFHFQPAKENLEGLSDFNQANSKRQGYGGDTTVAIVSARPAPGPTRPSMTTLAGEQQGSSSLLTSH
uniref:DOMON domain-containing protein n=1 Tax=Macrostomum lignano TaxID=282301 RepID=A0A1I8FCA1_9PLAT